MRKMRFYPFAAFLVTGCSFNDDRIASYFIKNPSKLQSALDNLAEYQKSEEQRLVLDILKQEHEAIYNTKFSNLIGSHKAENKIVMFLDHNCRYCKESYKSLISSSGFQNEKFSIIVKELPIIKRESIFLSKLALSSGLQGKYEEYLSSSFIDIQSGESIENSLSRTSIDVVAMKRDATSEIIEREISYNKNIAQKLMINSTPIFIYNGKLYKNIGSLKMDFNINGG